MKITRAGPRLHHPASLADFDGTGSGSTETDVQAELDRLEGLVGAAAPNDADYLVGTANPDLTSEIVVGTSPGGELGGTWASPTVDTTHSGSAHTDFVAKADPFAIVFFIDGGGAAIPTGGPKVFFTVPFACNVYQWDVEGDASTTTTFDVKKRAYGGGAATSMIGAGTKPFVTAGTENRAAPASWTTDAIAAGDKVYVHVDANNNATKLALTLWITR